MTDSTPPTRRKSLSKKLRFEVFKRDGFTCQYCGRQAPDVILEVDHIEPVAKGGTDEVFNLITSCEDCNAGKSDRPLSTDAVVAKQREQLVRLQERREQIEMMFEWQKGLLNLDDEETVKIESYFKEVFVGYALNDGSRKSLRQWVRRWGMAEVMTAIRIAGDQYLEEDEPGHFSHESVENAWKKIPGICAVRQRERDNPDVSRLYYIRGILRNRLCYCNEWRAMEYMKDAVSAGIAVEALEDLAKEARNWTQWRSTIEQWLEDEEDVDGSTP